MMDLQLRMSVRTTKACALRGAQVISDFAVARGYHVPPSDMQEGVNGAEAAKLTRPFWTAYREAAKCHHSQLTD
jgi:hypothetical protein